MSELLWRIIYYLLGYNLDSANKTRSYDFNSLLYVTLNGQILRRWVFIADVTRGSHERYENHWVW